MKHSKQGPQTEDALWMKDAEVHSPKLQNLDFLNCARLRSLRTSFPVSYKV